MIQHKITGFIEHENIEFEYTVTTYEDQPDNIEVDFAGGTENTQEIYDRTDWDAVEKLAEEDAYKKIEEERQEWIDNK